jgi:hypothetical protein
VRNLHRTMTVEALHSQIRHLIREMPDLKATGSTLTETHRWLGRVYALVGEAEGRAAQLEFQHHHNTWGRDRAAGAERIAGILYRALGVVEVELPASSAGAFITAGSTFDALAAVTKIFALAKTELLIVDPYLDEKIFVEFALFAPAGVQLKLLSDAAGYKETLLPAFQKWTEQYGATRPVEVRIAPAQSLHDRLMVVDGTSVWTVDQSFNELAVRASTSFVKIGGDTAELKIRAHRDTWNSANILTDAPLAKLMASSKEHQPIRLVVTP